jgi:acyl-coenzyme A synthetase/AMP-(fatty) acid ligase
LNITDYLLETGESSDQAIIANDGSLTYGVLREMVDGVATTLLDIGVKKGERVGIFFGQLFFLGEFLPGDS